MSSSSGSPGVGVMLAIHEKHTTQTDLYRPLRNYVSSHYSEVEAQSLEDDLRSIHQMRSDLERFPDSPPLDSRRDLLLSYLRALSALEPRFPISPDPSHVRSLSFTWHDAFRSNRKSSLQNLHLEKAAVLFNLGAVYSQIGLAPDRSAVDGLKAACANFQLAAGAFAYLRDNASVKASAGGTPATTDVSPECAGMLERLMLAQAQECFFEKVVADGKPPALCSKIARQVGSSSQFPRSQFERPRRNRSRNRIRVVEVNYGGYAKTRKTLQVLHYTEQVFVERDISRRSSEFDAFL